MSPSQTTAPARGVRVELTRQDLFDGPRERPAEVAVREAISRRAPGLCLVSVDPVEMTLGAQVAGGPCVWLLATPDPVARHLYGEQPPEPYGFDLPLPGHLELVLTGGPDGAPG
jgi:hypothetical protein